MGSSSSQESNSDEDPLSCCLGNTNGVICDPKYNLGSGNCDSLMASYCSYDGRIVKDKKCREWLDQRPDAARQIATSHCLDNLDDPRCRDWCRNESAAGRNTCDMAAGQWCNFYPNDQFCSCIKSPLQQKHNINPKCNDSRCLMGGYLTQNMRITPCPDVTNCTIQAKILNSGIQVANMTLDQRCGDAAAAEVDPADAAWGEELQDNMLLLFIVLIVLLAVIIMIAVAVYRWRKLKTG